MLPLDWQYVAGFFDGEGCIHITKGLRCGRGRIVCMVCQTKEEGHQALIDIQRFLTVNGIICSVGCENRSKNPKHANCWRLWINGWGNCTKFLELLYPYMRVKRQLAQDVMRFHKVFPYMTGRQRGMLRGESQRAKRAIRLG